MPHPTRRTWLIAAATSGLLARPGSALAHHGWSSFDQGRPLWLEGTASQVRWRNPHAELQLSLPPDPQLPADLPKRSVPAQSAAVDGPALLAAARLPRRRDRVWTVELAPLTRLQAWGVPEIAPGSALAVLGFTFQNEQGDALLRAEYLWLAGRAYGLRSAPA